MIKQYTCPFAVGQHVFCKVVQILPYGVFVSLPDGTRAYIRRRELSLTGDLDPRAVVALEQAIEAVVVHLPETDRVLELSYRATLPDPWMDFKERCREGGVVVGTVKNVQRSGVFVEIVPGIDGLVPASDVAHLHGYKLTDLFWEDDCVEAVVIRINERKRKVWLSIRRRHEQLVQVGKIMDLFTQQNNNETDVTEATQCSLELGLTKADQERPQIQRPAASAWSGRILVLEDSPDICEPLVTWLNRCGYEAAAAPTPAVAQKRLTQSAYDLLLVDIDLPDMSGLDFVRQMRASLDGVHLAIMSAPERLAEHASEIEALGAVQSFVKPLDMEEIATFLSRVDSGETLSAWCAGNEVSAGANTKSLPAVAVSAEQSGSLTSRIQTNLKELLRSTGADAVILFAKDPVSQMISIASQVGPVSLRNEALYSLKESPVHDVIRDGDYILETQVSVHAASRFRKLLDLLTFESCIGIPVKTGGNVQHALFLFHRQVNMFHRYHVRDAAATATLCAALLERANLDRRIGALNTMLLSGQLAASFGHEVYNKLSGLEIQLYNLQGDASEMSTESATPIDEARMQMTQNIDTLINTARDLRLIVENFQNLMQTHEEDSFDLCAAVHSAVTQLRPVAGREGVKIDADCPPALPRISGNRQHFQQVVFNLILNAIQQMEGEASTGNTVEISVSSPTERTQLLEIRVSDSGRGIHKQLWQKIFEMGFTTRDGGSGLGLYIARSLIEALGGTLQVERSVALLGTTFLITLPTVPKKETTHE